MPQLKEDEWPKDGEPRTSEEEAAEFKKEGPNPPGRKTGHSLDDMDQTRPESIITNVEPDQLID